MNPQRILGIVLLVVGVVVLVIGVNASHSIADQVTDKVVGRFTDKTAWYIVGGIASGLLGLLMVVVVGNGRSATGSH